MCCIRYWPIAHIMSCSWVHRNDKVRNAWGPPGQGPMPFSTTRGTTTATTATLGLQTSTYMPVMAGSTPLRDSNGVESERRR